MPPTIIYDVSEIRAILTDPTWLVKPPGEAVPPPLRGTRAGEVLASFARWTDGESHPPRKQMAIDHIGTLPSDRIPAAVREAFIDLPSPTTQSVQFLVPGTIVANLLGVPRSLRIELVNQVRSLVLAARADASETESRRAISAMEKALATVSEVTGSDDLEINACVISMIFQASDAMAALVGNALVALAAVENPSTGSGMNIVLTSMRERVPVQNTTRVRDGEQVVVDLQSAHRMHPEAGWTFGFGPHACPGRSLAVLIGAAVIDSIIDLQPFNPGAVRQSGWHNLKNVWIPNLILQEESE